jgi:hypothetical protein
LWVDAICINQNDIRERSEQVSIMGKIYQLANEVVVWLGSEKENSKIAIDFITSHVAIQGKSLLSDLSVNHDHAIPFRAILDLTKRGYWQRAWIIQEVFQARKITIHCGFDTLAWPHLAKFFRLVEQRVDHFESVGNVKQICTSTAHRLTKDRTLKNRDLYHLLQRYQDSMCSDPRDRVFSLCGMSSDYKGFVDYTKSPEDLFKLLCDFDNHLPMVWHRVRIAQVIQKALDLSTWDRWAGEGYFGNSPPTYITMARPDASLICRYSHHNIVANVSPYFPMQEEVLRKWYREFRGPNMPSLKCVKRALYSLTIQNLLLLRMEDYTGNEPALPGGVGSQEDFSVRKRLYSPGSATPFNGLRLFTTHNGRVGIIFGTISKDAKIARFADCDVALVVTRVQWPGVAKLRVFFVKDDRDDKPTGHSTYRFAIPDSKDTHRVCEGIRDADIGEGRKAKLVVRDTENYGTIKCTLGQLQFWTATHAPSKEYWKAREKNP